MNLHMTPKLNSQRPGSSARVYYDEKSDTETPRKRSKIPKMPKRVCSLEGRKKSNNKKLGNRHESNATSMIPRLEWKQCPKKFIHQRKLKSKNSPKTDPETKENVEATTEPISEKVNLGFEEQEKPAKNTVRDYPSQTDIKASPLESKINEDFVHFKNNVLRIPEFWTDAGQTVTNILKNAVNIVSKQYPTADVKAFEMEIQNILKATDAVKQQILTKTQNIIKQANKIYFEKNLTPGEANDEELKKLTEKMEDLRNEVNLRKNAFGELLKSSDGMKHLLELEKAIKLKGKTPKKSQGNGSRDQEKTNEEGSKKRMERIKSKFKTDISDVELNERGPEDNFLQSCGDIFRQDLTITSVLVNSSGEKLSSTVRPLLENKACQTTNFWTTELLGKEEVFKTLNNQIMELHQLCKDHISRFKSFNLQIKLRGICNKAQNTSTCKEIQVLNDEKLQLVEKNSKLQYYNKDLESALRQKDLDLLQKDRLISQQKKLLHVRDELIEMLKNRCNIEEAEKV